MDRILTVGAALGVLGIGWFAGVLYAVPLPSTTQTFAADTAHVMVPAQTKPSDVHDMNDPKVTAAMSETLITVPEDGWITSFSQAIHGAPESALRFSWIYDTSQNDPYCTQHQRVVFVMSVEKTPDINFPPEYGYFVKKGTKLRALAGFANFTDKAYENAFVTMKLSLVPLSSGKTLGDAFPLFLNAECTSLYAVAPKSRLVKQLHKPFVMPFEGRMVLLASHAHKYATDMLLVLNDKELWRTSPIHLPDGSNLGNPVYITPFNGVPVKQGDKLEWTVTYINPLERPTDAMSSIYIHILPSTTTPVHSH